MLSNTFHIGGSSLQVHSAIVDDCVAKRTSSLHSLSNKIMHD